MAQANALDPIDAAGQHLARGFPGAGRVSRRLFLAGACLAATGLPAAAASAPQRIVSLDYALAETLVAIGRPPIALADVPGWDEWVKEPPLPDGTVDVGLDLDPNLELIATLAPDLIVVTDYTMRVEDALRRIAPVERLTIYAEGNSPLRRSEEIARSLGDKLGAAPAATRLVAETNAFFALCRERAGALADRRPLLLVSLMDSRHVRVYGAGSLFGEVLARLGIANAWDQPVSFWGFATVGIEELARVGREARLVIFDPVPPDAIAALAASPIWTSLPFVRDDRVSRFPPILMFGALPSARRFARFLLADLEARAA